MARWGAIGCSQARALDASLDARDGPFSRPRPAIVRGRVVLFRVFLSFPDFPSDYLNRSVPSRSGREIYGGSHRRIVDYSGAGSLLKGPRC